MGYFLYMHQMRVTMLTLKGMATPLRSCLKRPVYAALYTKKGIPFFGFCSSTNAHRYNHTAARDARDIDAMERVIRDL